jgi:ribA/ribD-fused uncharacterized protein
MNNRLALLVVIFSLAEFKSHTMQPQARWKGRAIVMSRDTQTQQWRVLLAHRSLSNDKHDVWADFDEESRGGEKGNAIAARAVNTQTNNVFNISPAMLQYGVEGQKPTPNVSGDWFQFIPLGVPGNPPFISGSELYKNARNNLRDDFIWVSANDILNNQPIIHPRTNKPITISRGVHLALRNLLPGAIQGLNQMIAGAQPAAPAPQPVQQQAPVKQPARPLPVPGQNPLAVRAPWGPNKAGYIYFYQSGQPYYEFTNFFASPVSLDGKVWPTSEHYFQAQKYPTRPDLQERIRKAASPREAFNITREPANDRFKDVNWDANKFNVMLKAVRAKFSNQKLANTLIQTGNSVLVENAGPNDSVWGAGGDYMGTNHLGRILMHVRDELRNGQQKPYTP